MGFCEYIHDECPYDELPFAVEPDDGASYVENLMNIAEYFGGERSWEWYGKPWKEIREDIADDMERRFGSRLFRSSESARRARYWSTPEARTAAGVNFCMRPNSAYRLLKERVAACAEAGERTSVADERVRIKDELAARGMSGAEIRDAMQGMRKGDAAINRILMLNVEGATEVLSCASCKVGRYFPEFKEMETDEIAAGDAI